MARGRLRTCRLGVVTGADGEEVGVGSEWSDEEWVIVEVGKRNLGSSYGRVYGERRVLCL